MSSSLPVVGWSLFVANYAEFDLVCVVAYQPILTNF